MGTRKCNAGETPNLVEGWKKDFPEAVTFDRHPKVHRNLSEEELGAQGRVLTQEAL